MSAFVEAFRRGCMDAIAKHALPPSRSRYAPDYEAPRNDEPLDETPVEEAPFSDPPPVDDPESDQQIIKELSAQTRALLAENERLTAELAALKESKQEEETELIALVKQQLRESHASNAALQSEVTEVRGKLDVALQACDELVEEKDALENEGRKRPSRGRGRE